MLTWVLEGKCDNVTGGFFLFLTIDLVFFPPISCPRALSYESNASFTARNSQLGGAVVMLLYQQYRHLIPAPVDRLSANAWFVQTPMDNMSTNKPSTSYGPHSLQIKATFSSEVIHASMPRTLGDNRVCSRVLCPDCPHIWCRN